MSNAIPSSSLKIGFIGAGRLGTALAWSLARRGCRVVAATSRTPASAARLAGAIPGCLVGDPQQIVDASDLVFITTTDGEIANAVANARWRPGIHVAHCSGASELSTLSAASQVGAIVGGFHPMQAFGDPETAVKTLPGCTITIEADEPLNSALVALATLLECRVNLLPPGVRGPYHASGGYASQFVNVLLREASKIWQTWGATEEDALQAMLPLLRGTIAAIERGGLVKSMPGPVSRGDVGSVALHVRTLEALGPEFIESYRMLCAKTIPIAVERGALNEIRAAEIVRVLRKT
jgi:predicted short-subunit dehydrogenase-like oxidoreductase (DUF2520 family)